MNHFVPDFEMDEDCTIPNSSAFARPRKSIPSAAAEDEIMELLWQNGQVVVQSQTQMSMKKQPQPPSHHHDAVEQTNPREHNNNNNNNLFIQEDEMASWLHYPLNDSNFDQDFCADFLYPPSSAAPAACVTSTGTTTTTTNTSAAQVRTQQLATATASRPPIPPTRRPEAVQNFAYFSRHRARAGGTHAEESGPSNLKQVARESTVIDSSETPAPMLSESRISEAAVGRCTPGGAVPGGASNNREMICEMTVTSSTGGSSASAEPSTTAQKQTAAEDRKRKGREEETEYYPSEDVEFESANAKKQARGSTSTKRSRAAEVHNLSERRRRDRINEKMKALQELIPRCNKSDKASMLDEAIEYLKSLQLQVQMMSMGCSMVPMMFPGIQQYMPPMGMGMGMGMEMGMNRPMMPFPNVLAGSSLAAAAHMGPRFPMPAFHMPADPSRIQGANQSDPALNAVSTQNVNQARLPHFVDPYQQYLSIQQMQMSASQNQAIAQPSTSKPSSSQGVDNLDNHQSGT